MALLLAIVVYSLLFSLSLVLLFFKLKSCLKMTRIYCRTDYDRDNYTIGCQVFDGTRLVIRFAVDIRCGEPVLFHACRVRNGYLLFSEQRLFVSRVCAIMDGTATVDSLNRISVPDDFLLF